MAHWSDYTLRGWLSFLAFVHFGLLARSILDPSFIQDKIFINSEGQSSVSDQLTIRVFGALSLCQGFMLTHAAIHLYVLPVQYIAMFVLSVNIYFVTSESFFYKTMDFYGHVLLPSAMSIVSLLWLAAFHFIWKPWIADSKEEEHSLKSMYAEGKKKAKTKAAAAASNFVEPRFFVFTRNRVPTEKAAQNAADAAQLRQRRTRTSMSTSTTTTSLASESSKKSDNH